MFEGSSFSNNTFPEIHFGSADQVYKQLKEGSNSDTADVFDCAYFDPMFPPKRKKSAKSNKQMQFAQTLLQGDPDAAGYCGIIAGAGRSSFSGQAPKLCGRTFTQRRANL